MLYLLIVLPILGAIAIGLRAPARTTSVLVASLMVLITAVLCARFDHGDTGFQFEAAIPILATPTIALAVGIDGMSLILVLLAVIVTLAAAWSIPATAYRAGLQHASTLLIAAGSIGAFVSTDMLFFYAFHELALIPTFLLIGLCGRGPDAKTAAWRITIYLAFGSLVLLAGLIGLFIASGAESFAFAEMLAQTHADPIGEGSQKWIALLLLIGFGTLVALFPLHSWAAPAYASAPPALAMMHAGVLKKFGLYGLLRLALPMLPEGMQQWAPLLFVLLLGNILYVGLVTIAQRRLDYMLGNSSVMHMGYIFLAIAAIAATTGFNELAYKGAILLMFAHGISIALLFALAGKIEEKTGRLEMETLGGLGKPIPALAFLFGLGAFAAIGLPGFANFAPELMIFLGGFHEFDPVTGLTALQITTILAIWGVVISAVYMLRAFRSIFMGPSPKNDLHTSQFQIDEKLPMGMLATALLIVGFFPNILLQYLQTFPFLP